MSFYNYYWAVILALLALVIKIKLEGKITMKINWKVRLKHKPFLVAAFALLLLLVQLIGVLIGYDTTIYNERVTELFNTVLAFLVLIGVVVDPTTPGTNDSDQAMTYEQKDDAK